MKFGIKLGNIEIAGAKLENIELTAIYSMKETVEAYGLLKQILAEGPMLVDMINKIVDKVDSIDKEDKIVSVRRVPKIPTAIDLNHEIARKKARAEELAKRDMENFLKRLKEQNAKG